MKILVVGGGGREHALAWKLAQSDRVQSVYVAPGNGGTHEHAENVPIPATDIKALLAFSLEKKIDLVVVGPDDPLAAGIVDQFRAASVPIFGPNQAAAEIEASKAFAKGFMHDQSIPTASFRVFTSFAEATRYIEKDSTPFPLVLKASGLALGKGVTIAHDRHEAKAALQAAMVEKVFGTSGEQVVIEEFLEGEEVSFHALTDGEHFITFPVAQDHKAIFDGGKGPNTGGMGTISPLPWVTKELVHGIERDVIRPAIDGMRKIGRPFTGVLYPGLMITENGPKVLEFNARFGDPETQSYMRLLKSDLVGLIESVVTRTIDDHTATWRPGYAASVVLASGGYPGTYEKGKKITGLKAVAKMPEVVAFHAGTVYQDGAYYTAGGRVLALTARGRTLEEARDRAYAAALSVNFEGMQYRTDIGMKAIERAQTQDDE